VATGRFQADEHLSPATAEIVIDFVEQKIPEERPLSYRAVPHQSQFVANRHFF
jgi:hypothetical protein